MLLRKLSEEWFIHPPSSSCNASLSPENNKGVEDEKEERKDEKASHHGFRVMELSNLDWLFFFLKKKYYAALPSIWRLAWDGQSCNASKTMTRLMKEPKMFAFLKIIEVYLQLHLTFFFLSTRVYIIHSSLRFVFKREGRKGLSVRTHNWRLLVTCAKQQNRIKKWCVQRRWWCLPRAEKGPGVTPFFAE